MRKLFLEVPGTVPGRESHRGRHRCKPHGYTAPARTWLPEAIPAHGPLLEHPWEILLPPSSNRQVRGLPMPGSP